MSNSTAIVAFGAGAATVAAVYALLVRKASTGSRQLSAEERHRLESISIDDVWSPNIFANVPLLQDSDEEGCGAPVVKKLVLTGGPCAGKTTALARLATYLRHRGFRVFTVPEAATMLFTNGASFRDLGTMDKEIGFQANLLNTQVHLEDTFMRLAQNCGQKSVLLCDRGTMDGSAYLPPGAWDTLLQRYNMDNVQLRDKRYNAVIHLVTAADGAETFYSTETNTTRLETLEEARELDVKLQRAWVGHPKLMIFDNSSDFEGKLERMVRSVARLLGLPSSQRSQRKFLLRGRPAHIPVKHEDFEVEKVYIRMNDTMMARFNPPTDEEAAAQAVGPEAAAAAARMAAENGGSGVGTGVQSPVVEEEEGGGSESAEGSDGEGAAELEGSIASGSKGVDAAAQADDAFDFTKAREDRAPSASAPDIRMKKPTTTTNSTTNTTGSADAVSTEEVGSVRAVHASVQAPRKLSSAVDAPYPYGFVRRRHKGGFSSCGQTVVNLGPDGQVIEQKAIITARAYKTSVERLADPERMVVRQARTSFLWERQYFEIVEYRSPNAGLCLLNCQVPGDGSPIHLPPFLEVDREVTYDEAFSAYRLSLR